jgi:hypothetical protein
VEMPVIIVAYLMLLIAQQSIDAWMMRNVQNAPNFPKTFRKIYKTGIDI